jgi:anti-anti-sigma factor
MILTPVRYADVVVLTLQGRLDQSTAEDVRTALAPHLERCAEGQDHLVLDMAGVDYVSSAGLRVLMLASKQAKAQKGYLVLVSVQEILEISKFTLILRALPAVRDALAETSPAGLAAFEPR